MTNPMKAGLRTAGTLLGVLVMVGCAETPPSTFYTLSSLRTAGADVSSADDDGPAIGVGPISLPKYVDRPQIVMRASPNRLDLSEFDRWAEPLEEMFARVVAENLAVLMRTDRVFVLPRRRAGRVQRTVEVDITQFDTTLEGQTVLAGRWTVFGPNVTEPLASYSTVITQPIGDPEDFEEVVATMSKAAEVLSRRIAETLRPGDA